MQGEKKSSDAPDSPPYDPATFIRHVQTLLMKEQDEMSDSLMGSARIFDSTQSYGYAAGGRSQQYKLYNVDE